MPSAMTLWTLGVVAALLFGIMLYDFQRFCEQWDADRHRED